MKKNLTKALALVLVMILSLGMLTACFGDDEPTLSTEVYEGDVIYVGNTAGTTGALAEIGVPFNIGLEAAFNAYNNAGGFNGKTVALKHLDDGGVATESISLMEQLIHQENVFAVVGNYGGYAVNVNLDILKENCVPMIYAAAGVDALYNPKAETDGERCIFPVQPLNKVEGSSLIIRAFANVFEADGETIAGGLGAKKVGVIANQDEASQGILGGIKEEAENLPASKKNNIVYKEVAGTDFGPAATAIVAENCDTVIITVTGKTNFMSALTALAQANFHGVVLTSYNNSDQSILNDANGNLTEAGADILSKMVIYAQGWLDVSSTDYIYKADTNLRKVYKLLWGQDEVAGFTEAYWEVAEDIFDFVRDVQKGGNAKALNMSYNQYALAGYIAGNLFCNALEELEKSGKELTRANLVEIMESVPLDVAMAGQISYANGVRKGMEEFSASVFFDAFLVDGKKHAAAVAPYSGLKSISELRTYITE